MRHSRIQASRWLGSALIALSVAAALSVASGEASANSSPSVAKLQEAIAALEARVAALAPLQARVDALEARLQQYELDVTSQEQHEAAAARPLLVSLDEGTSHSNPMLVAPKVQAASVPDEYKWSGLYWGTSFGYGAAKSRSKYTNQQRSLFSDTSSQSSTFRNDDDSVETDLDFDAGTFESMDKAFGQSEDSDWKGGALADLYLGTTFHLAPRILAGVQVEGSLSEMAFESKINREKGSFKGSGRSRSSSVDGDGDSFQSTNSDNDQGVATSEFNETNKLELDWMVSVIGRAGWLATPSTLVYGLGGWTYGHFDGEDLMYQTGVGQISDFGSHGATVGGGFEQKLSPNWSLRAEYRYTRFAKENFSTRDRFNETRSEIRSDQSSDTDTFNGDTSTSSSSGSRTSNSTNDFVATSKGYFDNEMHVGRIGVTRYFSWGD